MHEELKADAAEASRIPSESRIQILPSEVIDQIAAGEVVERPSHLVKELIENALDAGATQVLIEVSDSGRDVAVTDNGRGLRADELPLALARHATSKIQVAEDLWRLGSYGFRGEALASIGAVSELTITSRSRDRQTAHQIWNRFGQVSAVETAAGNEGTRVHMRELFANVPARLKFLKSETAEFGQIKNVVRAMSLVRPQAQLKLKIKSKLELDFPAQSASEEPGSELESFRRRAEAVLGVHLYACESGANSDHGLKVQIAFAGPQDVSAQSRGIWILVQDRWVQDRSLQQAVIEAYRGLLMHGEFPLAVVRVSAPPAEVDVNIHPTKSQVKFRDASSAFKAVNRTLRAAIEAAPWRAEGERAGVVAAVRGFAEKSLEASGPRRVEDFTRAYERTSSSSHTAKEDAGEAFSFDLMPVNSHLRFQSAELDRVSFSPKADVASSVNVATGSGVWSKLQVLAQAHLTYLVCQDADRLVFVDQHAAHERVAFERLMRAWRDKSASSKLETQALLIPTLFDLDAEAADQLESMREDLSVMGFEVERMGPTQLALQSLPALIKESAAIEGLSRLANRALAQGSSTSLEDAVSDVMARMACHSVVRAGQALSVAQMRELLEQMDEFPLSSFCPHGRPVSVEYPLAQLERDFGRRV
jgi:DNA mismatch repair protein MutL